jgi:hypothetical protein
MVSAFLTSHSVLFVLGGIDRETDCKVYGKLLEVKYFLVSKISKRKTRIS